MGLAEGSISYADAAADFQKREDEVRGITRYAIAKHVFLEVPGGDWLENLSKILAESLRSIARIPMVCEEIPPAATQAIPARVARAAVLDDFFLSQHMSSSGDCRSIQNIIEICTCAWSTSTPTRTWRYITRATRPLAGTWFHRSSKLATRLDSPGWSSRRTCQR